MRALVFCVAALTGSVGSMGCTTSYQPAVSPRVAIVQTSSGLAFTRNGKQYEHGFFGGGLEEAVSGVPEAEAHASAYHDLHIGGFVLSVGSAIPLGIGIAGLVEDSGLMTDDQAFAFLLGSLVISIAGSIVYAQAPPHLLDAINIHNDAVEREAVERAALKSKEPLTPAK